MEGSFCTNCGGRAGDAPAAGVSHAAPPSAQPLAQQPPAKKSKALTYVLVGCGGLLVLVVLVMLAVGLYIRSKAAEFGSNPAFAAAKLAASLNPDVEVLDANSSTGKITVRDKKTGKTVTMDFRDIQKGRFSFEGEDGKKVDLQAQGEGESGSLSVKGPDGSMEFGTGSSAKVPAWVPKYPGGQVVGTFSAQGGQGEGGTFQVKCGGSVEEVASFYEREMKSAGMKIQKHSMQADNKSTIMVMGESASDGHSVTASVTSTDQGTTAQIIYGTKK
jgi:phosphotransferase system HPr-like phosphotransfer protein